MMKVEFAEILLPSKGIAEDVEFWTSPTPGLGFRMDQIYPADDPQVVTLSGHGLRLRLDKSAASTAPGTVRLLCSELDSQLQSRELASPSGTRVEFVSAKEPMSRPPTKHAFISCRLKDNAPWVVGRAGMHYRDLIPARLGGAIIASHIRIPDAGPVPDHVHYHTVGFQLIYCHAGWVRLVYEDQGEPFILRAGDCVIQPPQIRHRVLESSGGLEVVEVGVPAEHLTTIDHEMELPTPHHRPDREWDGQKFVHSRLEDAVWGSWRMPGFEARDTGVEEGTKGVAAVRVIRPVAGETQAISATSHDSDILFTFVLSGSCTLCGEGQGSQILSEGDAYTLPPGLKTCVIDCSADLSLLEVSLPGHFNTTVHPQDKLPA
ncbi:RmlC-like cupin domain-containing protein [Xylaria bambusicola]|uniref:RmlC-like cupin domain-containing protein n=1 Tax=Xylaria bambusicola TaxID=326684 RepID=UPI0020078776|nr:RmlC-like cupin domain-containing protein [Xylaria bambusicola]KAI0517478.1 RmlC-like cupin domain-containing protein [Xylaria bambusicola]